MKTENTIFNVEQNDTLLPFLSKKMPKLSRNSVKSLLTNKKVLVDGKIISMHNHKLNQSQTVTILAKNDSYNHFALASTTLKIIYEDDDLIVIDKPYGLLSIATDTEKENTAYKLLSDYVKLKNNNNRVYIVHRLDKETSGVFVIAKNEKMKIALQDNWEDLIKLRNYIAVVEGEVSPRSQTIISYLKETTTHIMYSSNRNGDGKKAVTNYNVRKTNGQYSLVDVNIDTGRKNQIRVHFKELGHSIVGDKKYGGSASPIKRMCLHANKLEFTHPYTNKLMSFEAKCPKSFFRMVAEKS